MILCRHKKVLHQTVHYQALEGQAVGAQVLVQSGSGQVACKGGTLMQTTTAGSVAHHWKQRTNSAKETAAGAGRPMASPRPAATSSAPALVWPAPSIHSWGAAHSTGFVFYVSTHPHHTLGGGALLLTRGGALILSLCTQRCKFVAHMHTR